MKRIDSINNNYIKELLKLHDKKYRDEYKKFLIEGYHLIFEAKNSGLLEQVLIEREEDYLEGIDNILVTKQIIEKLSFTKTPQNIIGVCKFFDDFPIIGNRFLLLDNIQDPGNLGTIVRSSLGFNIDMVILNSSSVDIYNDKFLRSTQGTIFKVKLLRKDLSEVIRLLKSFDIKIIGTSVTYGTNLKELPRVNKYALILGNEGNGVSTDLLNQTDINVYIETNKELESLNVAVAGSIIMYYLNI